MTSEAELEAALMESYERAGREVGYWGRRFRQSIRKDGAIFTAKRLLRPSTSRIVTKGFHKLLAAGREELSVEAVVLQPRFREMFSNAELSEARRRLGWTEPYRIAEIADALNAAASAHSFGALQSLRQRLHSTHRLPSRKIFGKRSTFEHYAFHLGGRTELQFNIGFERLKEREVFRHGVAFSLQLSRALPKIDPLLPKIDRYNEFLRSYPTYFADLRMWHYADGKRSENYAAGPVPLENIRPGVFVFLGKLQPAGRIDKNVILDDFARLLPLYAFVEGKGEFPTLTREQGGFKFSPKFSSKPSKTMVSLAERHLDKDLRHNDIQEALYNYLSKKHGKNSVSTEQETGNGTLVDAVVRLHDGYWFYEIKTCLSARGCIREALAQLLEYSYWPGAQEAERLIIVGEAALDREATRYLESMRARFSLPVYYEQFDMKSGKLVG